MTKKGAFPNKESVFKAFYLRYIELKNRWSKTKFNWQILINQLIIDENIKSRLEKYI